MIFWPRVAWGLGLCAGKVRANDPSRTPPLQRAGGQEMLPWLVVPPQVPPLVRPLAPPLAQPLAKMRERARRERRIGLWSAEFFMHRV